MKMISDECVGCPPDIPCFGSSCPMRNVVRFYCDRCGEENKLYNYYGYELCADCLLEEFGVIEGSDW